VPASNIQVVISNVNPYENLLAARLLEYFHSRTPWHRTLWNSGTILALREVIEASEALNQGHLTDVSLRGAVVTALRLLKDDPGMGNAAERTELATALTFNNEPRNEILFGGLEFEQIQEALQVSTPLYLDRWSEALASVVPPPAERASRAIASHLLDLGFNANYLHRWWSFRLKAQPGEVPLSQVVSQAGTLANQPEKEYVVLIPFPSELKPPRGLLLPTSWINAAGVSQWVKENDLPMPPLLHQQGGLLLHTSALDPDSAVQLAAERVELFSARVLLSMRKQVENCGVAWVQGQKKVYSVERLIRGIKIAALHRENRIWLETEADPYIDPAIELLAPLQSGATTAAIAGGWAAIEALLGEPKSKSKKVDPAERLATIVACSFPRAELTSLAYIMGKQDKDLSARLDERGENREKAAYLASQILQGACPQANDWADRAALARMKEVLETPKETLARIKEHANDAFARLYRQRNLILHAGRTRAVALRSTLRGATPLVGAGLDRICHARFVDNVTPIALAGRARTALGTVQANDPRRCTTLLGDS
jgi:hypothetical protein